MENGVKRKKYKTRKRRTKWRAKIGGKSIELRCIYLMVKKEHINSTQMVVYTWRRIKKCRSNNKFHIVAISDTHTHTYVSTQNISEEFIFVWDETWKVWHINPIIYRPWGRQTLLSIPYTHTHTNIHWYTHTANSINLCSPLCHHLINCHWFDLLWAIKFDMRQCWESTFLNSEHYGQTKSRIQHLSKNYHQ